MTWQVALSVLVAIQVSSIILTKVAANMMPENKSVGVFYQYLFCAVLTTIYFLFSGKDIMYPTILLVGTIGFINAIGSYCQWEAQAVSLSKTALSFPLMELITIILAIVFLKNEASLWNNQLIIGAMLCFTAMWIFLFPSRTKDATKENLARKWFFLILAMVSIFGIAGFFLKIFPSSDILPENTRMMNYYFKFFVSGLPLETILMGFYVGAFLGTFPILWLQKANPVQVSKRVILICLALSLTIAGAVFAISWTYQLKGPVSLVIPIRGTAIILIPALFGLLLFGEKGRLSQREWFGFLVGVVGAALVLLR